MVTLTDPPIETCCKTSIDYKLKFICVVDDCQVTVLFHLTLGSSVVPRKADVRDKLVAAIVVSNYVTIITKSCKINELGQRSDDSGHNMV